MQAFTCRRMGDFQVFGMKMEEAPANLPLKGEAIFSVKCIAENGTVEAVMMGTGKSGTVLDDPFFVGNILRNMKKDVSLRCWNKNTDSHAKTVSTKKWNRHISRDVERYQQAGYI